MAAAATEPTGRGTLGLIAEGQALDAYLTTMENKSLARSITKFMHNFSMKVKSVHKFIPHPHKDIILSALRSHYQLEFKVEFGFSKDTTSQGPDLEKKPFTLGMGYIKRLTSPDFIPTTKTQIALIRKRTYGCTIVKNTVAEPQPPSSNN